MDNLIDISGFEPLELNSIAWGLPKVSKKLWLEFICGIRGECSKEEYSQLVSDLEKNGALMRVISILDQIKIME